MAAKTRAGRKPVTPKTHASKCESWPHAKPFEPVGCVQPTLAGSSNSHMSGLCMRHATLRRRRRHGGRERWGAVGRGGARWGAVGSGGERCVLGRWRGAAHCCTRPMRPAETASAPRRVCSRQLAVLLTAKKRPAARCASAAAARVRASATSVVIGFSISTCSPASIASMPCAKCVACGVPMSSPSHCTLDARSSSTLANTGAL
eukprot:3416338-Prymnesium_polylepis.3